MPCPSISAASRDSWISFLFSFALLFGIASKSRADSASQFETKQKIGDHPAGIAELSEATPSGRTDLTLSIRTDTLKTVSFSAVADPGTVAAGSLGQPMTVSAEWIAAASPKGKQLHILSVATPSAPGSMPFPPLVPFYLQPQFKYVAILAALPLMLIFRNFLKNRSRKKPAL